MRFIQWLREVLQRPAKRAESSNQARCPHDKPRKPFTLTFEGVELRWKDLEYCPACAEEFLRRVTTRCGSCTKPIFPSEPVGQAPIGSEYPYTHLSWDCSDTGGLYCGVWGEGRLITLHEVDPKQFPPGTSSVLGHVFNTGETVARNIP